MSRSCSALSASLLIAAASVAARAVEPSGPELFSAHGCQACHRIGRLGGDTGPDLSFVGVRRTEAWLAAWIANPQSWKHSTLMPDLALRPGDLAALAHFLSERRGQDYESGRRPWDGEIDERARGAAIYRKAGCVACHGAGGAGGEPNVHTPGHAIPALRELVGTYTSEELFNKIVRGSIPDKIDPAGPDPVAMPAWSTVLSENEIRDVIAYLRTLKPSHSAEAAF